MTNVDCECGGVGMRNGWQGVVCSCLVVARTPMY